MLEKLLQSVEIIQALGENPNIDDGLSSEELKMKFDEAARIIKSYLNDILVPYINGLSESISKQLDDTLTRPDLAAQAKAVGNALTGKLSTTGGTMSGAISMGGNKITGLGTPTDSADAVSKAYADQKYSPNNKPTPADIGALPTAGGTMSGYLNFNDSNGLSWTTADGTTIHLRPYAPHNVFQITMQNPSTGVGEFGAVSLYTNGNWEFRDPTGVRNAIGAATSGYGWGETNGVNVPYGDPDYVDRTCIFVASKGNIPAGGVWLGQYIASGADGDMTARAYTGPVGSICKRYKLNGEWQPWEWVNPPMADGVEYRTTERYKYKPVYAKAVSLNLAGAGNKYVSVTGHNVIDEVVSFTVYMQNDIFAYDLAFNSNIVNCFVNVDSGNFFVNSADMPDCTVKAIVKYTKK